MRIMIVTDQYPPMVGGVPNVTQGLAVDFVARGHQVSVVAPSYSARDSRRIEDNVRVYRFSSFEWPTYKELRIVFLPFLPIRNAIKKHDPDIIHIHSPVVLGNVAQILAGGLRKPVVATNHYLPTNLSRTLASDQFLSKHFSNITYSYLVHFCNRCEFVTAPTQTALNLLYDHGLHVPARVVSNGIDVNKFTPGDRDPDILERFKLPTDRPLILHVNRLSEEKRVNVLLDAVATMRTQAHIALVSTGPAEADLRAQVERLSIGDRVSFLGFVRDEELLSLRRSSDIFAIPSEADLQSLATMEAMACGLPVIAANSYALPELVHHEQNGYLFQPGNSDELASRLDELVLDSALRKHMGTESLKIIARHDRVKVLEQWEEIYRRLAIEFQEKRDHRRRAQIARKYPAYLSMPGKAPTTKPRSRIRHTNDLSSDEE